MAFSVMSWFRILIQLIKDFPNLNISRVLNNNFHERELKALSKLCFSVWCIISYINWVVSSINLPFIKPYQPYQHSKTNSIHNNYTYIYDHETTHPPVTFPKAHYEFSTYKISYKLFCHSEFCLSHIKSEIIITDLIHIWLKNSKKYHFFLFLFGYVLFPYKY